MSDAPHTMAQRLRLAREARKLTQVHLSAIVGLGQSGISKIEKHNTLSTGAIGRIAEALRVPVLWLELGQGPLPDFLTPPDETGSDAVTPYAEGAARALIHSLRQTPQRMTWDVIATADLLPAEFEVQLPDNAMSTAPTPCPAGTVCTFRRASAPLPGEAMLVRDARGELYFREVRVHRDGTWSAYAYNQAFPTLHSNTDELDVLAVFDGMRSSWSAMHR